MCYLKRMRKPLHQPWLSLLAGLLVAFLALAVDGVRAHSDRVESSPEAGAVLLRSPNAITIQQSGPLAEDSVIQVVDEAFRRQDKGGTTIDPQDPTVMRTALNPLPPGGYTVQWTAVDRQDGHSTRGSFTFSVLTPGDWAMARLATALRYARQLNRRSVIELVNQYWHILLGSWAIKAGLTVVAGRWYVRRRAARRAAAALAAVEALWEDERS